MKKIKWKEKFYTTNPNSSTNWQIWTNSNCKSKYLTRRWIDGNYKCHKIKMPPLLFSENEQTYDNNYKLNYRHLIKHFFMLFNVIEKSIDDFFLKQLCFFFNLHFRVLISPRCLYTSDFYKFKIMQNYTIWNLEFLKNGKFN